MSKKSKRALILFSSFIAILIIAFVVFKIKFMIDNKDVEKEDNKNKNNTPKLNTEVITTKTGSKVIVVKKYDKSMFENKKSLVFFWASWCSHCIDEITVLKESMENYKNRGFNIYTISHDNDLSTLIKYIEDENITFDVYFDLGRITRKELDPSADSVPLTYVINEDLSIGKKKDGSADLKTIQSYVDYIETNN